MSEFETVFLKAEDDQLPTISDPLNTESSFSIVKVKVESRISDNEDETYENGSEVKRIKIEKADDRSDEFGELGEFSNFEESGVIIKEEIDIKEEEEELDQSVSAARFKDQEDSEHDCKPFWATVKEETANAVDESQQSSIYCRPSHTEIDSPVSGNSSRENRPSFETRTEQYAVPEQPSILWSLLTAKKGEPQNRTENFAQTNVRKPTESGRCSDKPSSSTGGTKLRKLAPSERLFSCQQCAAHFKKMSGLAAHVRAHSNEKPFSCKECPAKFKFKTSLAQHLVKHPARRPFECNQCLVRFKTKTGLTEHLIHDQHLVKHPAGRPFACKQCLARFKTKTGLTEHLAHDHNSTPDTTHSNETSFPCGHCAASFDTKSHLSRHVCSFFKKS